MGFFGKIKESLFKTRGSMGAKVDELVQASRSIDDDFFDELSDILVMADVGVQTSIAIVDKLRAACEAKKIVSADEARAELKRILIDMMIDKPMNMQSPSVLFVIGVNGVGKTTFIGKLSARLKTIGRRVLIVAGDTFRAAAADQLTVWSERADVPIVKRTEGADPASVLFDGITVAKARHADVIIVDTAGRLHNKTHLMEELKKMARVVGREYPEAQMHALLVIDSTTGQNGLNQARIFKDVTDLDGIVLTKLDGTAKGGIALAIRQELGLPVRYIGLGEGIDDMQPFDAKDYIDAIL